MLNTFSSDTLWLQLTFPALQLESGFQEDKAQPVIIVDGRENQVCQCNQAASEQGIHLGMGLGSAAALCGNLQVIPYNEQIEREKLSSIARWLYLLTSDIALLPPNSLLLRVSNMLSLYRGLTNYWQQLSAHLNRLNLSYHYGTGYSPIVADILAQAGVNLVTDDKAMICRLLSQQPLEHTKLSTKHITQLKRIGIEHIGQLQQLPLAQLAKRFDKALVDYVGKLGGQLPCKIQFHHPEEVFSHYLELFYEVSNCQYLQKPLQKSYLLLERFLRLRGKLAFALALTLYPRDEEQIVITIEHAAGSDSASSWLQLTQLKLEHINPKAPLIALDVKATRTGKKVAVNGDIFQHQQALYSNDELIAILQAKLGAQRVCSPKLSADARPEVASTLAEPLTPYKTTAPDKLRPSVLLSQPTPLCEQVNIAHGPERIVSGWWDQKPIKRDYFLARNEQGKWLWLFRTPEDSWFVHGVFY